MGRIPILLHGWCSPTVVGLVARLQLLRCRMRNVFGPVAKVALLLTMAGLVVGLVANAISLMRRSSITGWWHLRVLTSRHQCRCIQSSHHHRHHSTCQWQCPLQCCPLRHCNRSMGQRRQTTSIRSSSGHRKNIRRRGVTCWQPKDIGTSCRCSWQ